MAFLAGCSPERQQRAALIRIAATVTLTSDQRQHVRLYTVASSQWHKTIDATGVVDFDNDHATSVLAPFSGPVSRLLV